MEEKNNIIASQAATQSLYQDACVIIDQAKETIFHAVSRKSENILQSLTAKYLTYMPTKEELRREIEQQKEFFRLQNEK